MRENPHNFEQLWQAFADRRIAEGYSLLRNVLSCAYQTKGQELPPAELLLSMALWIDIGYCDDGLLDEFLLRFTPCLRQKLSVPSYLRLRLVEAWKMMVHEDEDPAIRLLDFVLAAQEEFIDPEIPLFAHYFKARAHRKKGEYEKAYCHIVDARRQAKELNLELFEAVIQIQEAWLLFQNSKTKDAIAAFNEAQNLLINTDDYLSLANIESARGRIVRRSGEYVQALKHYDKAIALYRAHYPQHRNLARTLINAAYVKRLLALQLRRRIDATATNGERNSSAGNRGRHSRYVRICEDALDELERAGEIYAMHDHPSGTGSVLVNAGYLHLDQGNVDRAAAKSFKAYELGHSKNDHILMARARILESAIESHRVDEQLADEDDLAVHANAAKVYAEEAVALAAQTQNRRLIAGAWIARGMAAANDFFLDWDEAKQCASRATALLSSEDRDHLWEDLVTLKGRILRASGIDETLRAWSQGIVGKKTFQQIQEEFAELVIPKVWVREGKNISRVVEQLSVSPKKIRRILRNTGFLNSSEK